MEELCERLDAQTAARTSRATSSDMSEDMANAEDSEEAREKHRRLLAEIRSCFRLLSIHSRLTGSESPRTRRILTQTDSCESLHSFAAERAQDNNPRVLRGLSQSDDEQNSLSHGQLIIGSTSNFADASSSVERPGAQIDEESCRESIHQRPMLNPTSRLQTVVDLSKSDVIKVIEWLYRDHPGAVWRAASRQAMEDRESSRYLIYGEISFVAFAKLLEQYCPQRPLDAGLFVRNKEKDKGKKLLSSERGILFPFGFTFYDLGCGAGRPVYMASLLNTNCTKACGIEIIPSMHEMNKVLLRLYNLEVQPNLHPAKQNQQLDFLYGDFLQIDWSDADMIFTNATCFGDPLFEKFEERAAKVLKPGAVVISVTRSFRNLEPWEHLERQERQMSWAPAMVYVYRKKGPKMLLLEPAAQESETLALASTSTREPVAPRDGESELTPPQISETSAPGPTSSTGPVAREM